jgi:hypothetical protein
MTRGALLGKRLVRAGNIGANDWREQPLARTSGPNAGMITSAPASSGRQRVSSLHGEPRPPDNHRCAPIIGPRRAPRTAFLPLSVNRGADSPTAHVCSVSASRKAMPPSRSPSAGLCRRFHACAQISPFAASEAAGRRVGEKGSPARQAFWLTGLRGARAVRCRYTSATSCAQALGFLRMLRPQYVSTSHPLR